VRSGAPGLFPLRIALDGLQQDARGFLRSDRRWRVVNGMMEGFKVFTGEKEGTEVGRGWI
jgi:hypothetical protein